MGRVESQLSSAQLLAGALQRHETTPLTLTHASHHTASHRITPHHTAPHHITQHCTAPLFCSSDAAVGLIPTDQHRDEERIIDRQTQSLTETVRGKEGGRESDGRERACGIEKHSGGEGRERKRDIQRKSVTETETERHEEEERKEERERGI